MPQLLQPEHPRACTPQQEATAMRNPRTTSKKSSPTCSLQLEKPHMQQQRPSTAKNQSINKSLKKKEMWVLPQATKSESLGITKAEEVLI